MIVGPDGAPWITDGGLNAIVRVDPATERVQRFPLPRLARPARTSTPRPSTGAASSGSPARAGSTAGSTRRRARSTSSARRGAGPYGITTTPDGEVYYASLAGSHIARIDSRPARRRVLQPPTRRPGRAARLVGLARPDLGQRVERGPGRRVRPGDEALARVAAARVRPAGRTPSTSTTRDVVWLTDFGAQRASCRFDPATEPFTRFPLRARRQRAPAARPARRGLGRRVGRRPARRRAALIGVILGAPEIGVRVQREG